MAEMNRRGLITGLVSFAAAPAIVRSTSLMPIKSIKYVWCYDRENNIWEPVTSHVFRLRTQLPQATWRLIHKGYLYEKRIDNQVD